MDRFLEPKWSPGPNMMPKPSPNETRKVALASFTQFARKAVRRPVEKKEISSKTLEAYKVGFVIAEKCKKIGVNKLVFDRGGYKYHGRLKALADGARDNGMEF